MKPIEFEKKYEPYGYDPYRINRQPSFTGREIKEDIKNLLKNNEGFAIIVENECIKPGAEDIIFTKRSIQQFADKFVNGISGKYYPLANNKYYTLSFSGPYESILTPKYANKREIPATTTQNPNYDDRHAAPLDCNCGSNKCILVDIEIDGKNEVVYKKRCSCGKYLGSFCYGNWMYDFREE